MNNNVAQLQVSEGEVFATVIALKARVFEWSTTHGHTFRVKRSDRNRTTLVCKNEEDCLYVVKAVVKEGELQVREVKAHTCSPGLCNREGDGVAEWVASVLEEKVRSFPDYGPKAAAVDLKSFRDIPVKKGTVEKGLAIAKEKVYGKRGSEYGQLQSYFEALKEKNPEMTFSIERRRDLVFASCFWAFLPPVAIDYLLPVIFSDACGLYGSFRGVLLVTLGLDANRKLLPLGFTISASEDLQSWTLHNRKILAVYGNRLSRFTLFSDRQKGLESDTSLDDTIRHHAICINHLVKNVAVETSLTKQEATKTVWELAKADSTKVVEVLKDVKQQHGKKAHRYLKNTDMKRWADAYWPDDVARCDTYTSNAVESINSLLKPAREGSVLTLIQQTRRWLTDKLAERRGAFSEQTSTNRPIPPIEQKIREETVAFTYQVTSLEDGEFEVGKPNQPQTGSVVKEGHPFTCSCPSYRRYNLPCMHILRVAAHLDINTLTDSRVCPAYLWTTSYDSLYQLTLKPEPAHDTTSDGTLPPEVRKGVGRPKKTRIRSAGETIPNKCGKCRRRGHNSRSCRYGPSEGASRIVGKRKKRDMSTSSSSSNPDSIR